MKKLLLLGVSLFLLTQSFSRTLVNHTADTTEAAFEGNATAWKTFLMTNLDIYVPILNEAPSKLYSVKIKFTVSKRGNLSQFEPLTNMGYGMEQEAVRVLKLSPRWKPAMHNGEIVESQKIQTVNFLIPEVDTTMPVDTSFAIKKDTLNNNNEVTSEFVGGAKAWALFLTKNLKHNVGQENNAPTGRYSVPVCFSINEYGAISNIKTVTNYGYGMEEEVVRVIKLSPRWLPGLKNNKLVRSMKKQIITFAINRV